MPPVPYNQRMRWFLHDRFGMFIHWGLYSIPARGEWLRNAECISEAQYQPYFDEFNPARYDPRKWAALAKAAGQKYVVLTAKHHDGFCLFDSKLTDYKATKTPAGRDLIAQYVQAVRDEGLKVGLYYSLIDWHHPHYPVKDDKFHPMRNNPDVCAEKRDTSKYVDYLHGQVRELLTNYGKIDVIWFDFSYDRMSGEAWRANELVNMARSLQPGILMDNRLLSVQASAGREQLGDFASPEQVIPPEGVADAQGNPVPWEACITLNDHWGYGRDDHEYKDSAQVVRMLVECVAKGGNLLLNVGPTALGEIPGESVEILQTVGQWMDYNGQSIHGCGRCKLPKPEWGYFTQNGRMVYAHLFKKPVGHVAIEGMPKVRRARLLADGSEVSMSKPWNANSTRADAIFLTLPGSRLADPLDTVVALELNEDL
jgi:alpha-L-fucosidase